MREQVTVGTIHLVSPPSTDVKKMVTGRHHEELSPMARVLTSLAAGAVAGGVAKTVIAPLDRSKIFFQTSEERNYRFRYALRWLRHGYRTEGFLSLWRGNSATMARIIPYAAIQFMSHEQYKMLLGVDQPGSPGYLRFLAGSMAGVTGQAITYPMDRARAVMAVTPAKQYSSLVLVFMDIWREEGVRALYRGLTPTLLGVVPYAGTSFFTYESLKGLMAKSEGSDDKSDRSLRPGQRLAAGAVAGLLGQTASYPLDIVRRRMQTGRQLGKGNKYKTIRGTITYVWRNEGFRGLYKGLSMNFIKGPTAASISFTVFDYANLLLKSFFAGC